MRGFRDHRKLTMVGVGVNQGHCSFYHCTICMGIAASNFIATTPSFLELRYRLAVRLAEKESDTDGFRVGFGGSACVGLRIGGLIQRRTKNFSMEG